MDDSMKILLVCSPAWNMVIFSSLMEVDCAVMSEIWLSAASLMSDFDIFNSLSLDEGFSDGLILARRLSRMAIPSLKCLITLGYGSATTTATLASPRLRLSSQASSSALLNLLSLVDISSPASRAMTFLLVFFDPNMGSARARRARSAIAARSR